ncbi:fibronectin type III-like domain-contianing protein [Cellulosilyticum ruminicola]|uniref:fibronectin type III-like domain-contianing protein n=1 Tax=Cellulosilyticum ruminicola TaxID=425254 RepID=UPI00155DAE44|nr:fibronectin type III-like domain-contianing protein [Cellulosilyticum ruminicola]
MSKEQNSTGASRINGKHQIVNISDVKIIDKTSQELSLEIKVHNKSRTKKMSVIKIYIRDINSIYAASIPNLYTFETVELEKDEEKTVTIKLNAEAFTIVDEKGDRYRDSNEFEVYICVESTYNKKHTIRKKVQFQSMNPGGFSV